MIKIRVKRGISEFKILNFKSYKKFYFHCLANAEQASHESFEKSFPLHDFGKNIFDHYTTIIF